MLKEAYLLAYELEACENFSKLNAVLSRNSLYKIGSNYSLYRNGLFGHSTCRNTLLADIFEEHSSYFISCEQYIIVTVGNGDTYTVAVGIGSKQKVGLFCLAKFKTEL